jgi:hypothetical protein
MCAERREKGRAAFHLHRKQRPEIEPPHSSNKRHIKPPKCVASPAERRKLKIASAFPGVVAKLPFSTGRRSNWHHAEFYCCVPQSKEKVLRLLFFRSAVKHEYLQMSI